MGIAPRERLPKYIFGRLFEDSLAHRINQAILQFLENLQHNKYFSKDGKYTSKGYEEISKYTLKIYYGEYERMITDNSIQIAKAKYDFEEGLNTIECLL